MSEICGGDGGRSVLAGYAGTGFPPSSRPPELLAPAGGFEQLRCAIHFGADAVYLGGDHFGLRKRADNFSDDDLAGAVAQAHAAGVKVHVTINSLLHESDLDELVPYLHLVEDAGADAIIAGDMATIVAARRETPALEVHVSTQLSCANHEAALLYRELGAKRVVLARELSLAEIATIRSKVPSDLELEVFVHGAMCMAYSGRCLISSFLAGRDANRGYCAQPCRWHYALEEQRNVGVYLPMAEDGRGTSILSSKDLMMLDHLDDLADAGVDSIKIEGRVKSAYYVATVVNAYRHVLDGADPAVYLPELEAVSHRPYHTGFFYGDPEQTVDETEYEQTHLMVGVVTSCQERRSQPGIWRMTFQLRNRLQAGQTVEVLSPKRPVRSFLIGPMTTEAGERSDVANRTCEVYEVDCPVEVSPGDILRRRREKGEERCR